MHAPISPSRLDRAAGDCSAISIAPGGCCGSSAWIGHRNCNILVSGRDQSGYVSLGRTTTVAALKKARELLLEGYIDVRICTPQGRMLLSDEFDQFEA